MWGYAERRGAASADLSGAQMAVLQTVYDEFRTDNAWPTMYRVDRALIKSRKLNRAKPATILAALPEGLLVPSRSRPVPGPQDQIKMTVSGVARCAGAEAEAEAFWRTVRWCARQELKREPLPGETSIEVTWLQARKAIPASLRRAPGFQERLFHLLTAHQWGWVQAAGPMDEGWTMRMGFDARRFRDVASVEDFIDVLITWREESTPEPLRPATAEAPVGHEPVQRSYVKPVLLEQLVAVHGSRWDTTKLVALVQELDACVRVGHVYASHAVLRALLDHVPPVFGQQGFAAVASNHSWGKTDARYMKALRGFRDQADDALHRQISRRPDPLMKDDLPSAAAVNALLGECVALLQTP
jgi:hypothetical protein